jgi:hypothetical protein
MKNARLAGMIITNMRQTRAMVKMELAVIAENTLKDANVITQNMIEKQFNK